MFRFYGSVHDICNNVLWKEQMLAEGEIGVKMKLSKYIKARYKALYYKLFSKNVRNISIRSIIGDNVKLEGANSIGQNTYIEHTKVGYGSYLCDDCDLTNTIIGKYCSIGPDVKRIKGTHPTNGFISTYPGFFSPSHPVAVPLVKQKKFEEYKYVDSEGHCIVIGNDVWIGYGARLLDGIKIGNGAIIAAGAVVVKDVEPYSIVGGVPARIIRYRFALEQIKLIEQCKWWDKSLSWLEKHADMFSDIEQFVDLVNEEQRE